MRFQLSDFSANLGCVGRPGAIWDVKVLHTWRPWHCARSVPKLLCFLLWPGVAPGPAPPRGPTPRPRDAAAPKAAESTPRPALSLQFCFFLIWMREEYVTFLTR